MAFQYSVLFLAAFSQQACSRRHISGGSFTPGRFGLAGHDHSKTLDESIRTLALACF